MLVQYAAIFKGCNFYVHVILMCSNISVLFSEIISMLEKDGKVHFDRTDYENMLKKDLQYVE